MYRRLAAELQKSLNTLPLVPSGRGFDGSRPLRSDAVEAVKPPATTIPNPNKELQVQEQPVQKRVSDFQRFCIALQTIEEERLQFRLALQV